MFLRIQKLMWRNFWPQVTRPRGGGGSVNASVWDICRLLARFSISVITRWKIFMNLFSSYDKKTAAYQSFKFPVWMQKRLEK